MGDEAILANATIASNRESVTLGNHDHTIGVANDFLEVLIKMRNWILLFR